MSSDKTKELAAALFNSFFAVFHNGSVTKELAAANAIKATQACILNEVKLDHSKFKLDYVVCCIYLILFS